MEFIVLNATNLSKRSLLLGKIRLTIPLLLVEKGVKFCKLKNFVLLTRETSFSETFYIIFFFFFSSYVNCFKVTVLKGLNKDEKSYVTFSFFITCKYSFTFP